MKDQEVRFCGRCGLGLRDGDHEVCRGALELEPPRFCPLCRRRLVVAVSAGSWSAECSMHGQFRRHTWFTD
jgi:hypothetical protein